jgi:glycine hydroxymethyltransferase
MITKVLSFCKTISSMDFLNDNVRKVAPKIADAIKDETDRQNKELHLIASENHVSKAVLEAQGSVLTNKYAEGYPDERYYAGCENMDKVEKAAIKYAKELWGAEHVNVQPHSGTQANMAVYLAVLDVGDTILSLKLNHGGHLSHGHEVNFTSNFYECENYTVSKESGFIDYDYMEKKAKETNPDIIVSGYSAYPREVKWKKIQDIADSVGAYHLADIAHITGLVAAGVHSSPVGIADFVTGSTHKTIRAGRGGIIMTQQKHSDKIDSAVFPGSQGGPMMHNIAGKAVGFKEALSPKFNEYAKRVVKNSKCIAEELLERGFKLVSGGTDNHIVLVDLQKNYPDVSGGDVEEELADVGIILNANTVPGETGSPLDPSGIRIGTPAITSRGLGTKNSRKIAKLIADVIDSIDNGNKNKVKSSVKKEVKKISKENPIYKDTESATPR